MRASGNSTIVVLMSRSWVVVCLLLGALASGGCTKYAYYGYQYRFNQEFVGEDPETIPVEARQLLASAKTVAFYPPDICINTDTQISGDRKRVEQLRASCGVLLSTLERAAEGAGYEVLSWQNLRGSKRAIEYAREANVDVLFEINQFDLGELTDKDVEGGLAFFEREDGHDRPIQVPHAAACLAYAQRAQPTQEVAITGTIDIKTVSVSDGRSRWRYRTTRNKSLGTTHDKVLFGAAVRPHWAEQTLGILGIIGVSGGGGLLLAEQLSEDNPLTPEEDGFDSGGVSKLAIGIGVVAIAGAIAVRVALGGQKPPIATTLCNGDFAVAVAAPKVVPVTTYTSEVSFARSTRDQKLNPLKQVLHDEMMGQFINVLKEVHGHRPSGPAPTLPPAPTPPAATP